MTFVVKLNTKKQNVKKKKKKELSTKLVYLLTSSSRPWQTNKMHGTHLLITVQEHSLHFLRHEPSLALHHHIHRGIMGRA